MSFAVRLKEKRMRDGLSLQELADKLGISKGHVYDLEIGKSKNPSADLLKKLSDHFNVSIAWWVGEEASENEPARVMFRQFQELSPADQKLIQGIMELRKQSQKDQDDDANRSDAPS